MGMVTYTYTLFAGHQIMSQQDTGYSTQVNVAVIAAFG